MLKRTKAPAIPTTQRPVDHINAEIKAFNAAGEPVISVDTKKKELVVPELGKVAPYGVYDVVADGWVNLGISRDTAAFAVASIRRWWHVLGAFRYPSASDQCRLRRQQWQSRALVEAGIASPVR
jgi:hypothetical protein